MFEYFEYSMLVKGCLYHDVLIETGNTEKLRPDLGHIREKKTRVFVFAGSDN